VSNIQGQATTDLELTIVEYTDRLVVERHYVGVTNDIQEVGLLTTSIMQEFCSMKIYMAR